MVDMKIENYTGTADTFTFPNNPRVFDANQDSNHDLIPLELRKRHIVVSGGGVSAQTLVITGFFYGASKLTNFRSLSKHFSETKQLKKLYFESDKFYLGVGKQLKKTNTGGRTNFIDYVGTFQTIVGIGFGDTQRTSGTNDGNTTTYIETITGTTKGVDVTIIDDLGNSIKIPNSTSGQAFSLSFVSMQNSGAGISISKYNYCTIGGTVKQVEVVAGEGVLELASGANMTTIEASSGNPLTDVLTTPVVTFRDGWTL